MMGLPSCKELVTWVSSGEIEEVSWYRRFLVRVHLGMCKHCKWYVRQIKWIGEAFRWRRANLTPERKKKIKAFQERIIQRLKKKFS